MGDYAGEYIEVRDDTSYEVIAKINIQEDFGDRVTRIQIAGDVLFVCEAGNDNTTINTIHAAPLSPAGQEFFNKLVANLSDEGETEAPTEAPTETEAPTDEVTEAPTEAPTDAGTEAPTEAPTEPAKSGCGSALGFGVVALLIAAAAFAVTKKD